MVTCKYCGQELQFLGARDNETYFNCTFCDLVFPLSETSVDRKRKKSVPEYLESHSIYQSTSQFLERDTITLYHVLQEIRAFWYSNKKLLENLKVQYSENALPNPASSDDEDIDDLRKQLKHEFIILTKKKFVVENIILERTGFLPDKITDDFLGSIIDQGREASKKPMYVYIK